MTSTSLCVSKQEPYMNMGHRNVPECLMFKRSKVPYAQATPTSSQAISQLAKQPEREDANTSYLTSSRWSQPSPPSLFLPEVHQAPAADSVVVTSSHKATLSPSTTPRNTAPISAAHRNTQLALLIILVARGNKSYKVAVRDTPAWNLLRLFAALKSFHVTCSKPRS